MAIATLIAAGRLDDRLIDRALGSLREIDPKAAFAGWIDEGDAVDLRVSGDIPAIRWALDGLPETDVFVQPEEYRFKRLLIADMDSTMIAQECIDELADFAGLKQRDRRNHRAGNAGTARLQGRSSRAGRSIVRPRRGSDRPLPRGARRAQPGRRNPRSHHAGRRGSRYPRLRWVRVLRRTDRRMLGFNEVRANRLVFDGRQLSGSVEDPIVDAQAKLRCLDRDPRGDGHSAVKRSWPSATARTTSSWSQEAGLGVAYRPKPALAEVADARLDYHGLDALLWAQGIRRRDWVST